MKALFSAALVLAAVAIAGCTVHQTAAPGLSGPSDLALSIRVTALPDSISQDGGSQSSIQVTAIGPDGKPLSSLALRMDMFVGGVGQDYGTLSGRTIVTNSNGVATVVYTAPPSPTAGIFGTCKGLPGNCVQIVATPTGLGFETATSQQVTIRLVPPGVILPPASTPTAAFTFAPVPPAANSPIAFDASASCPGQASGPGTCSASNNVLTGWSWTFGDGQTGSGQVLTHSYTTAGTYNVTLTVTNDRGLTASVTKQVSVGAGSGPTAAFVFSPSPVVVNLPAFFDASASTPAPGHTVASYTWNWGDGAPVETRGSPTNSHIFTVAGSYVVLLTVADEAGQKGTTSQTVSVTAAGGGGGGAPSPPTSKFTFSPTAPGVNQDVFFNGSSSTAASGHSVTNYAWDFGDGNNGTGVSTSHPYSRAGTFTVTLVVTDDLGQRATSAQTVTVSAASSQIVADFVFSPTNPAITPGTNQVFFDATPSSSPSGITSYIWDFGDGSPAGAGQKPNHTYVKVATFVVRLTVSDGVRSATITKTVTVGP